MKETQIFTLGKYAEQRREMLEKNRPDIYNAMLESGSLNAHLAAVQEEAENYVENYVARFTNSEEYLKAEKKDPAEAMRLLNMTVLEAEDAAYRIWTANFPENENEEEDENV